MNINFSPTCQIEGLEKIYDKYFSDTPKGIFVEVGAFDGETHSNTSGLADYGWEGVYVEPIPEYHDRCSDRHKNNDVVTVNCLIGGGFEDKEIKVAGELSTTINNPELLYHQAGLGELYVGEDKHETITVRQMTLNNLLSELSIPYGFDLLVLDTEGMEWEILYTFDIGLYKPKMVIIEMHEDSPEWMAIEQVAKDNGNINRYMWDAGYETIHRDGINTIFIRGELMR
jgi:FkbM family methyltransferase